MRRRLALLAFAGVLTAPSTALAVERQPQPLVNVAPLTTSFSDRVITGPGGVRAHAAQATKAYQAPDGTPVDVAFDVGYLENPTVAQTYVDYLGSLPHGSELSQLKLLLAPPAAVKSDCGGTEGVLACYDAVSHQMVVPGEQIQTSTGVSTSYVIAHEYGHHIATFRDNRPFKALDWGPKYWASYKEICNHVLEGRLVPGDEGNFYRANPGEGWAETYARLTYPQQPWTFDELLKPDQGALDAARRDVLTPWTQPVTQTFTGRFTSRGPDVKAFRFPLTLDGTLRLQLSGPAQTNYDLVVSSLGTRRGSTKAAGSQDVIKWAAACRQQRTETVTVQVARRTGTGLFSLAASYAG